MRRRAQKAGAPRVARRRAWAGVLPLEPPPKRLGAHPSGARRGAPGRDPGPCARHAGPLPRGWPPHWTRPGQRCPRGARAGAARCGAAQPRTCPCAPRAP
eukprot:1792949-Lingulodinium_polyedra.AAC.1